ncbi:MAG: 50S ribosomal protein L22 [Alphaproteobacteria bacterium]|nr:50S ribosomal protein L22 [Alphaproteobacteria bacterium]
MGKSKRERVLADNEAMAISKNLRVSPQKLNLVAGLIRGKKVDHAMADLEFSRKRIAVDVRKCVMSAVANAENNHGLDVNDLVVAEAHVGRNIVMRRFHARGRGRAAVVEKPFSQITVVVREDDPAAATAKIDDKAKKSTRSKADEKKSADKPAVKTAPAAKTKAKPAAKKKPAAKAKAPAAKAKASASKPKTKKEAE